VASPDECKAAIAQLAARLAGPGDRRAEGLDRSVSAEVTDLGLVFRGHLHDGVLDDITTDDAPPAQIRLILSSDDLVLLAVGELSLGSAWLSGRVKLQASLTDMLRLRTMI
jgi:hypothetical protein